MEELLATGLTFLFAFAVSTATSRKVRRAVVQSTNAGRDGDRDQTEGDG
jgi:hypothetical protein